MSRSLKKNSFFAFLLFFFISFALLGTPYFKYAYCFNIVSLFLFAKFQLLNLKIIFLNLTAIFFLIISSNNIDISRFLIIVLLFIFSFQFKISKKININIFIIFLLIFFSIFIFFLYPSSDKFYVMLDVSNTKLYHNLYEEYDYNNYLLGELANIKPPLVKFITDKDGSADLNYCYDLLGNNLNTCKYSIWSYTRLSFNKLDPNLAALILISFANFLTFSLNFKNNFIKIIIFIILYMVILYATKSRVLYIYLFSLLE